MGSQIFNQKRSYRIRCNGYMDREHILITWSLYTQKLRHSLHLWIQALEYLVQKSISLLLDEALEKTCLFEYTETNGLGIIHILFRFLRFRREMEFMDENQTLDIYTSFLKGHVVKTLHQKVWILSKVISKSGTKIY